MMRQSSFARAEKLAYRPPGAPADDTTKPPTKRSSSRSNLGGSKTKLPTEKAVTPRKAARATPRGSARDSKVTPRSKKVATPPKEFLALSPRSTPPIEEEPASPYEAPVREHARRRQPTAAEPTAPPPIRPPPPSSAVLEARGHNGLTVPERMALETQRNAAIIMQKMQRGKSSRSVAKSHSKHALYGDLKQLVESLERAADEAFCAMKAAEAKAEAANVRVAKFEQQHGSASSAGSSELQAEILALRAENVELRAEVESLDQNAVLDENERLESEVASLRDELHGVKLEVHALRSLMSGPQLELAEAQLEIANLKEENARLRAKGATDAASTQGQGAVRDGAVASDPAAETQLFRAVGYDPKRRAYIAQDASAVRTILAAQNVNVNCRDGAGSAPLAHAAWIGKEEVRSHISNTYAKVPVSYTRHCLPSFKLLN
jgi:FtsZ-binding cell division protein ZapB